MIATATPTLFGWLARWDSASVANGSYGCQAWPPTPDSNTDIGAAVSLTVDNPTPTAVLIPSKGATLSGTAATLDASGTNATSVEFWIAGGPYGYGQEIGTATLTLYGWLDSWNTASVPNGSYALLSEATGPGGSTFSSGVSITVKN